MGTLIVSIAAPGFLVCFIWLLISLIKRTSLKTPAILMMAFFNIFAGGLFLTSPIDEMTTNIFDDVEEVQYILNIDEFTEPPADEEKEDSIGLEEQNSQETIEAVADSGQIVNGQLSVHFIDVGQGDSIFIKAPSQNILIDGGNRGDTVLNYLRNQGVSSLDLVIGTHPHADHIGGLINVMQAIPVIEVIDPAVVHTTITFEDYLDLIDQKNIKFTEGRAGIKRDLGGGAQMEILHPTAPSGSQLNDASVVVRITFGEVSFIFTGDTEKGSEQAMISRGVTLKSDILKVGHHGSINSTTQPFLNAVSPSTAVISCGKNNQYNHPHDETLLKLAVAEVDIHRTDLHGSIVITTDGISYKVNKEPYIYEAPPPVVKPEDSPAMVIEGQFVGSSGSNKYHYPECHYVNSIKPENRVWFRSVEEAVASSYIPCKGCNPPGVRSETPAIKEQATQPAPVASSALYVGSKNSEVFHYPTCHYVQSILPHNLREYESRDHAINAGKRPCKTCKPP